MTDTTVEPAAGGSGSRSSNNGALTALRGVIRLRATLLAPGASGEQLVGQRSIAVEGRDVFGVLKSNAVVRSPTTARRHGVMLVSIRSRWWCPKSGQWLRVT